MKVMLMTDLHPLGLVGDVVDVKPGYARNYLLPHHLACAPTEANVKRLEEAKKLTLAKRAKELAARQAIAKRLNGTEITIQAQANELGHLFGSVGAKEIADALAKEGYNISPDDVKLPEPIKQLDKYTITIEAAPETTSQIELWVVPTRPDKDEDEQAEA